MSRSHPLRLRLDDRFRYARQRLDHLVDASGNPVERLMFRAGEAGVDHMVHKIQKRPPVAVLVDQHDRLVVQPELLPGDDLEGFRSEEHTSELTSLMRISYAV